MKFYIVDVFAENRYEGNQLAVFTPEEPLTERLMQQIAREVNYSETTFIMPEKRADGGYEVRIFSPAAELPFAGHPTLGTAAVIERLLEPGSSSLILHLQVGPIRVERIQEQWWMEQNQPMLGTILSDRKQAASVLQLKEEDLVSDLPVQLVSTGLPSVILPLVSLEAVSRCLVDHHQFKLFLEQQVQANIVAFARTGPGSEDTFRVRCFINEPGFLEDPATGSANGNLAGYLVEHQYFGNSELINYSVQQGVEMGRPSRLAVQAGKSEGRFTIRVGGKVVPVASGEWLL
ncbi:PhzF family phenazine biosynthesis protein [Paenibacillus tarimensis]|uniref:PhzF family phenazine biosynthesis protein n=1 Tax=Paenibacillus tarimensis TaxID=416012 RepID=UPI001F48B7B7|nr:PhzF family phenazine biosynthesis protein [Paenibacillus tarimensis]MCF2944770.1 PhzF family phenazine biosynthesis protein [Paenibacillus tarimensis]